MLVTPLHMKYLLALTALSLLFTSSALAQVNIETRNITPNITLVWESDSYVPPFYKGKALMPDGGDGRIIALLPPEITPTNQTNYLWRVDGVVDGAHSGIGKNIYTVTSEIFGGSPLVSVEVSDAAGLIGSGVLRIPLVNPRVLVYADAPLGGVLFNIEAPRLTGEELTIETYPLFFTTKQRADPALSYLWRIDDITVNNPLGNSGRLVLRSESAAGTTTVGVSVTNSQRILENASGKTLLFLE